MPNPEGVVDIAMRARKFLDEIPVAEERHFPSIGHGTDHRYRTPAPNPSEAGPFQHLSFQRFSIFPAPPPSAAALPNRPHMRHSTS